MGLWAARGKHQFANQTCVIERVVKWAARVWTRTKLSLFGALQPVKVWFTRESHCRMASRRNFRISHVARSSKDTTAFATEKKIKKWKE